MKNYFPFPKTIFIFILTLLIVFRFQAKKSEAQNGSLPKEEVDALKEIADQMGKTDWDFDLNLCDSNDPDKTFSPFSIYRIINSVVCICSFPGDACHVQKIFLSGQDLAGVLSPSLAKLPFVTKIDFSLNYLSGTIPSEWNVKVNRLSGPIPDFLGGMTNLLSLDLRANMFNGSIPASLGNLANLMILNLGSNNLTGELPAELSKLENLEVLSIEASGFAGPIPSNISTFKQLNYLRISDLNGGGSSFPLLSNMTLLTLRSCHLSGTIPDLVSQMLNLRQLDLSFNNLKGEIPKGLQFLPSLQIMYLTGNSLSGTVPAWIQCRDSDRSHDDRRC